MNMWDKLILQAVLTLNLIHQSSLNPGLFAFAQVWGQFDYNLTSLAPSGAMVMVHEKKITHETSAPRASEAWYLGPAFHH